MIYRRWNDDENGIYIQVYIHAKSQICAMNFFDTVIFFSLYTDAPTATEDDKNNTYNNKNNKMILKIKNDDKNN